MPITPPLGKGAQVEGYWLSWVKGSDSPELRGALTPGGGVPTVPGGGVLTPRWGGPDSWVGRS